VGGEEGERVPKLKMRKFGLQGGGLGDKRMKRKVMKIKGKSGRN